LSLCKRSARQLGGGAPPEAGFEGSTATPRAGRLEGVEGPEVTKALVRVGVLGDAHGQDESIAHALRFFERRKADAILCVGDIVDGPGDVDRCVSLLRDAGAFTVRGNHERWFLAGDQRRLPDATPEVRPETRAYFESLPATLRFATPAGPLLLCHGVGEDDMAELRPDTTGYALQAIPLLRDLMIDPEVSYAIGGHTHEPMVRRFQGLTFLNAGALLPSHDPCVLWVDFAEQTFSFHDASPGGEHGVRELGALPAPAPLPEL
jgi:predicted phosphodiesterase